MRVFLDAHSDWLTVVAPPGYAPELNPTEGVWAYVKCQLSNHTAWTVDQLAITARTLLKRIQYRPDLIDGSLDQTDLTLD